MKVLGNFIPVQRSVQYYEKLLTEDTPQFATISPPQVAIVGKPVEFTVCVEKAVHELRNGRSPEPIRKSYLEKAGK